MVALLRRQWFWSVVLAAYALVIFVASSLPLGSGDDVFLFPGSDKLLHAVEFAVFLFLARLAFGRMGIALIVTAAYAASDELHQVFVAARDASLADFGFDLLGAALAAVALEGARRSALWRRIAGRILDSPDRNRERGR